MPLIPVVGRRTARVRLILTGLYVVLAVGAVTTVYPFLVMLGSSVTSDYDQNRYDIVPQYLLHPTPLFAKYAEEKYCGDPGAISAAYDHTFATLQDVTLPPAAGSPDAIAHWNRFFAALPLAYKQAGFQGKGTAYTPSPIVDLYQDYLRRKFDGNIHALDREYTEEDATFLTVYPPFEQPATHTWLPKNDPKTLDWVAFERTLSEHWFRPVLTDPIYDTWLKEDPYNDSLAALNSAWGTNFKDFTQIRYDASPSGNASQRKEWETFTRTQLPIPFLTVAATAVDAYRRFLSGRYHRSIGAYNKANGAAYASFEAIPMPNVADLPASGVHTSPPTPLLGKERGAPLRSGSRTPASAMLDWISFVGTSAPLASLRADTLETRYRAACLTQAGFPADVAAAARPPIWRADAAYALTHAGSLRRDFLGRNYTLVLQYILLHGHSVMTTVIYCSLAVLTALIVNPLCAYALSRFRLPYASSVLLFLLATMAFPAEVSTIPNFLLLKQLGLLNTFWSLILPGAASGYWIFLLKGFFDSLPQELYQAGMIDGASELTMFRNITLPLSRPIFAVIALGAFTAAFGNFLFALINCQDPRMWTLLVWVYELQSSGAPNYVMLAALTLVSIPPLIVFILSQRIIMQGIIVPTEK